MIILIFSCPDLSGQDKKVNGDGDPVDKEITLWKTFHS